MTSTSTLRDWWSDYLCDTAEFERVAFPGPEGADQWNLYVAREAVPAFEVLADIMSKHGYLFRESAGGTYNCRKISGSNNYSLHAYAVCIDLNPSKNPYGTAKTDQPKAMTDELAALRTGDGSRVFTWGMNWTPTSSKDPMHWQIDCSPSAVASGIIYDDVIPPKPTPPPSGGDITLQITRRTIRGGDNDSGYGQDVRQCQAMLVAHSYWTGGDPTVRSMIDGIFGDDTTKLVKAFQKDKGLTQDGVVGEKTWGALEA